MNTRVSVELGEDGYRAVTKIAQVERKSRGRVLSEALEPAMRSFIKIAQVLEAADTLKGSKKAELMRALEKAEKVVMNTLAQVETEITDLDGVSRASAARGGARGRPRHAVPQTDEDVSS